jgi:4-amino-4-deoxy-L-arabinose transferase-like glycosyltransferase
MDNSNRPTSLRVPLLFAVALLMRLAVVWLTVRAHPASWFFDQANELARLAESLRAGHGLSSPFGGSTGPSAFLSPGYPALVAAVFAIFHPYSQASAAALMLLQALFGAGTVVVLMLLARRAFGVRTANIAGAIWAVSPPLLWLPTLFWESSLSILLAASLAALALRCAESPTSSRWLAAGVLAAFALSVNPSLLPIIICCSGWAIYRTRSRSITAPIIGILVCVLLSTPWVLRNQRQLHAFIPLRDNLGYELWQGNRPGSDGFFLPELHPNVNHQEFGRYQELGEVAYMREKSAMAMETIRGNPARFLGLTLKRCFYFWTGVIRHSSAFIVEYIVITSLSGFSGLALLWRRDRQLAIFFLLPLLFFPLPYYITHPDFRFRLVLDPLLTVLAAYAFTRETTTDSLTQ